MSQIDGLIAHGVRNLKPYQPGKPVESLERELGLADVIKLASNENPRGVSPNVVNAVNEALSGAARYPDGSGTSLKCKLAERLGVSTEELTLGNGSNDVLDLVVRAFVNPGEEVVVSEHAFAVYVLASMSVNAQLHVVPASGFGHDLAAMSDAVTSKTKLVFVANPNNPTGTYSTRDTVEKFLAALPPAVLAVLDEAYFEYVTNGDYPDGVTLLSRYPNLIVVRTFSKAYGLAGLRVGYGVTSKQIAEVLNRVRHPFNVNALALAAAEAALGDETFLAESIQQNLEGLKQLASGLEKIGLDWIPSVANFICARVGRNAGQIYQAMLERGVIVRPVANYGLPEHLRISIGLESENVRALKVLSEALTLSEA